MYSIRTTPGFVIASKPYGEAGKVISIFTRDLGLVVASAEGVRKEGSKLRYHCAEYSFGTFSLVRGKEFWRLTSAAPLLGISDLDPGAPSSDIMPRIALVLRRLLQGEEPNSALFDIVESAAIFLAANPGLDRKRSDMLESLAVLRMMQALGYAGEAKGLPAPEAALATALLDSISDKDRILMNSLINKAFRESHL